MHKKILRILPLLWFLSLGTDGVDGLMSLTSQTSQPWTFDATPGKTKFRTCFDGNNYIPIAANVGGFYIRKQTEEFYTYLARDPTGIFAIGCAGGRFDVIYSASNLGLYGLGLSYDSNGLIIRNDFMVAPAFETFSLADFNYPEDYTSTYTFVDGVSSGQCRYMNSLGDALAISINLLTDICLPIGSTGSSTYLSAWIETDTKNYTITNINNIGPPTVLPFQFDVSTDVTTKKTFVVNSDYYLTSIDNNVFSIIYLSSFINNMDTVTGVISSSSIIFKSDVVLQYNGAIITGIVLQGGNLHILIKLQYQTIISRTYMDILGLTETSLIDLVQLNATFFRVNFVNGTAFNSVDFLLDNVPDSPPVAPIEPQQSPVSSPVSSTIIVVSVNSSVTIDDLVLNQTTVLVIQNEAVVTVTNCASLAGTLKYILSQSQYQQLIANNTLDVLVLLTQCTNGSFDAIQVIAENQDDCVTLEAQPNRDPAQLTLLITAKQKSNCGKLVIDEPLLSTGAIIGIVIGCAAAVTLIIVLALYFSPVSAKVFPYAKRNK